MKIFLSYRRSDVSLYLVPFLREALSELPAAEEVFLDVDSLTLGAEFAPVLRAEVERADLVLALIGPGWDERRLAFDDDWVRNELVMANASGRRIIPLLLGGRSGIDRSELPDELHFLLDLESTSIGTPPGHVDDVAQLVRRLRLEHSIVDVELVTDATRHDTGEPLPNMTGRCAFLPSGELAVRQFLGHVGLWDPIDATLLGTFGKRVDCFAVAPAGDRIATFEGHRGLRLWDIESRGELYQRRPDDVESPHCCAFSPDGLTIAAGGPGPALELFDAETGDHLVSLDVDGAEMRDCAYSSSGLLVGSGGDAVKVWDPAASSRPTLEIPVAEAFAVAVSRDGSTIATTSHDDRMVRVFDEGGNEAHALSGHRSQFVFPSFSPVLDILATQGEDGVILWDPRRGTKLVDLPAQNADGGCAFSSDGSLLAAVGEEGLRVYSVTVPQA
jgi:WD40 repeat protein